MKFYVWEFSRKLVEKVPVSVISDKNNGTAHADRCTVLFTSRSVLLRMRNVSDISCTKYQNTFCIQSNFLFENLDYKIMRKI